MKKIVSLFIICLMICGCESNKYQVIDSNKAMELIENGAIIVDVREVSEFSTGHIKDAINIPLGNIDTIEIDKNKTIIVYCATGVRSREAVKKLNEMGYESLYDLDGGLINWGFEVEE